MAKKKKVGIEVSDAKQARELILTESSPFNMLEAYKAARTNLIFTMNKSHENKAIVVTSAMANDGKTTSCINLAITFAQTGSKVIVIDSDMRNPSVHRYMKGVKNAPGLSNVLGGFNTIEESIQKAEEYNNLYIMSAGVIPPNPSELIYSDAIENLLRELSKDFDYIFVDSPPLGIVTDALILGKRTLGIALVVRQDATRKDAIKDVLNDCKFNETKVLGFILNGATSENGYRYGKYGKYGKYGGYGYGYGYGQTAEAVKKSTENK